jgi:protein involved in temperature-dependent protein secretion
LARKTDWVAKGNALYVGLGQRMLATEQSEFALTEARKIELTQP